MIHAFVALGIILLATCVPDPESTSNATAPPAMTAAAAGVPEFRVLNLTAYPAGPTGVRLAWRNPNTSGITDFNITSYHLVSYDNRSELANLTNTQLAANAEVSYNITGLVANGTYNFGVRIIFAVGSNKRGLETLVLAANNRPRNVTLGLNTDGDEDADAEDSDDDNDGVLDDADNCQFASNPGQVNRFPDPNGNGTGNDEEGDACDDTDDDGHLDNIDNCPVVANPLQENEYGGSDGEGDACDDTDRDRILDAEDLCPIGTNGWRSNLITDRDEDGCRDSDEDFDDDGDGVNDDMDSCPMGETGWRSDSGSDRDDDGCRDSDEDVDDDGNGLIEISTPEEFDMVRDDLAGASLSGDNNGCVSNVSNSGLASECNGYELISDLDLAGYTNWTPIGDCGGDACSDDDAGKFATTFDGNGYTISDLTISSAAADGVGLFGAAAADAELRNLFLTGVSITVTADNVGVLLGYGAFAADEGVTISNMAVTAFEITGNGNLSGLLGAGPYAAISSSYVRGGSITGGGDNVGGLVGSASGATISSSYAAADTILGSGNNTGGLVGSASGATISSSYAVADNINGSDVVGGLLGEGGGVQLDFSYALSVNLTATGGGSVDGLVGGNNTAVMISDSYWLDGVNYSNSTERVPIVYSGNRNLTLAALREPSGDGATGMDSIYESWGGAWCDPDTGAFTTVMSIAMTGGYANNPAWDFGMSNQFPALSCFGREGDLSAQRAAHTDFLRRHPRHNP